MMLHSVKKFPILAAPLAHLTADSIWVYLHQIFLYWAPKDASYAIECVLVVQLRSSKLDDFGISRKCIWDFLLVYHSNYGPVLYLFWYTATYGLKITNFPILPSCIAPLWMFHFVSKFAVKITMKKLESWGYCRGLTTGLAPEVSSFGIAARL